MKMKRILNVLFAMVIIVSLMPLQGFAFTTIKGDIFSIDIQDSKHATFSLTVEGLKNEIQINQKTENQRFEYWYGIEFAIGRDIFEVASYYPIDSEKTPKNGTITGSLEHVLWIAEDSDQYSGVSAVDANSVVQASIANETITWQVTASNNLESFFGVDDPMSPKYHPPIDFTNISYIGYTIYDQSNPNGMWISESYFVKNDNSLQYLGEGQLFEYMELPLPVVDAKAEEYLYDVFDPGAVLTLPMNELFQVEDKNSAVLAINAATLQMSDDQKNSATGIDLATLFAEEAVAQAASETILQSDITINQQSVSALQETSKEVASAAESALASGGIAQERQLRNDIKFKTNELESITITVEPSAVSMAVDNVRVQTPIYEISIPSEVIKEAASSEPLVITVSNNRVATGFHIGEILVGYNGSWKDLIGSTGSSATTYSISFSKPVKENIKVSLPPAAGDPAYQAITNSEGIAVGGKYNPATQKLDVKIKDSDTYTVQENRKNFSDISSKSKEMQEAIEILASKGIINGTTETQFSPDGAITRAEIATLIVKALSKYDSNANGGFSDVKASDWYCGAIGSAKQYGIINGLTEATFGPKNNIQKDQIVAIAARTLKSEMKYKDPEDALKYLATYTDGGSIPAWAHSDIALATRENLVLKRADGTFGASATMTRGDAAIILYRMFNKVW